MKKYILIIICICCTIEISLAQKRSYNCDRQIIEAQKYYDINNYEKAAWYYKLVIDRCGEDFGQASQKLADCNRKIKEKKDAEDSKNQQLIENITKSNSEETAFKKCTTIPACEAYLKRFPNGKHAEEVRERISNLKWQRKQDSINIIMRKQRKIEAEKTAYMEHISVDFANANDIEGNNLINKFGSSLAASDMRYLIPRIKYDGRLTDEVEVAVLYCQIRRPDGSLIQWSESPYGYTYYAGIYIQPHANQSCLLPGYGNSTGSVFAPGTYTFEIYYYRENEDYEDPIKLYSTSFTLYNNNFTLSSDNWRDALEHCLSVVTQSYENDSYKGFINAGRRSRMGVYKWSYGAYYFGKWNDGLKQGWGILVKKDGYEVINCPNCCYFVGNFDQGVKSGKGSCYDAYGNLIYYGNFVDDAPIDPYPTKGYDNQKFMCISQGGGNYYLGEVINNQPKGKGIFIQSNGSLWFGEWSPEGKNGTGCNLPFQGNPSIEKWSNGVKN